MDAAYDDTALFAWVTDALGGAVQSAEEIQTLWSGYGHILRLRLSGAAVERVIVKHVRPPSVMKHPRGWAGQTSHERKLRSYAVERAFYLHREPVDGHRTARCFAAEASDDGFRLLLEDLDAAGFPARRQQPSEHEMAACLRWLASFHAHHLGARPEGLWPVGTYWHLDTRRDELAAMDDDELRAAAAPLDAALQACPFRTLVHGDAKVANFCFGSDGVAAVDFQYVGGGCGVQDVAYLLSSCLDDDACELHAERHLDTYFAALRARVADDVDGPALELAWRGLYPAAWADFHRFLVGWAPDHWKIHRYTRRMTREALARL
ncbi:MAG: choline kinase [Planctomycetota bacterium]|nr:choline kinase [Planctomycetota bacterium]